MALAGYLDREAIEVVSRTRWQSLSDRRIGRLK